MAILGPEYSAEVAVRDGEAHHGQHVGHQEEDNLVAVVQQGGAGVTIRPHHDTGCPEKCDIMKHYKVQETIRGTINPDSWYELLVL